MAFIAEAIPLFVFISKDFIGDPVRKPRSPETRMYSLLESQMQEFSNGVKRFIKNQSLYVINDRQN